MVLFADGLRFDVSQRLASRMRAKGWTVVLLTRWAGLPTVTATAKPAASPVAQTIKGLALGEDFLPVTAEGEKPLTTDRFRKLLASAGYQYLGADETGDPAGRGWTENGALDKLGHSLQGKLAGRVDEQVELLLERIEILFEAGWREIRVVTDHGWLWLPGGLPKVDLPKYLTASRWARCAAIKGSSKVEVPTVRWHWNRTRAGRSGAWHRVLRCRQRIRPRRIEPPGEPYPDHPGHCGQSGGQDNGGDCGGQLGRIALPRPGRGRSAGSLG